MQFSARTKYCLRACHINKNKPIVFRYDHFSANAAFRLHYLIEATTQGIGRSLSRYSCLMLRSVFSTTDDNNNIEYSNQLNETLYWQATIQRIFFSLVEDSKQYVVTGVNCQLT